MSKRARNKPARRKSQGSGTAPGKIAGNIHVVMFLKLLVVMVLLFISRLLFYVFNLSIFSDIPLHGLLRIMLAGLRFDLSALLILNLPFILMNTVPFRFRYKKAYQGFANGYFYLVNAVALMTNFIDIIYFRFTLKRMTADIFRYMEVGGDFGRLIPQFIKDFWYVQLLWIGVVVIMVFICRKFRLKGAGPKAKGVGFYLPQSLLFALFLFFTVIGIRGGFQLRPINLITAGTYAPAQDVPLVLNTPFSIVRTITHESLDRKDYFPSEADLARVYSPVHRGKKGVFRAYNVLIVIMESFSREHIGFLNKNLEDGRYRGFTPVFDSIIQQGVYFEGFANGKTSIVGIPAILSSLPSLMNDALTQTAYSGNSFTSIAGLLKPLGYSSAFFHGGSNGTMGYDGYTRATGFDHYFGRTEYNNERDYDGKWGIRDEEFLQYTARQLDKLRTPFVAAVFTLSAHHPYYVPGKYRHMFREGKLPIQQSIMYSDYALGRFLDTIRRMPWYGNTLIVITADHTSEGYYPYYKGPVGQYSIPILFLFPGGDQRGIFREIAQQTDILPTIFTYLGYDRDYIAFGSDMLDPSAPHFSVHYNAGVYTLISQGYVLEFNGSESTSLYDINGDPDRGRNLLQTKPEIRERMERFIKAYIQQYNNRLIENRLTVR